ncbi:MAG: hypothetical protein AWU59_739 [Methanolobus sp. T82-4]|jgi:hypothetical protein|nr:MAG: hypothetical protein AWU59_739 [Methanolobus sp. T82-4]
MQIKEASIVNTSVNYKIYLDMDNVITDFDAACNSISYGLVKLHRTNRDDFWKVIESQGINFWSQMEWKIDGKDLVSHLLNYNTTVLSAHQNPRRGRIVEFSIKGKYDWLVREISKGFADKAIICRRSDKTMYADPFSILIDDNSENIKNWEDAGGIGVLHYDAESSIGKLYNIFYQKA